LSDPAALPEAGGPSAELAPAGRARRGGPQLIPRPSGVEPGPGAWWSREGAVPPPVVPLTRIRWALGADGTGAPPAATTRHRGADAGVGAGTGRRAGAPEIADSVLDDRLPMVDPRPAAVLCALFEEDGDTWVVLTRRSTRLRSHTGEVSFPGGRLDAGETAVAAALREADEEVGIDPASVEVIGELAPLSTMSSRSAITPFVGVLDRRPQLRPNPAEVDRAFTVPLSELMAPGVYHEERWAFPGGGERAIHFFDLPGDTVWGATAKMLRDLLDRVYPASP
jgi:8-oxo-dGTP pyrophosphatase MutT (NUDIX family)